MFGTIAALDIDSGATAWLLACTALVLLMTPGLGFFYGGMVRAKNVLGMLMQSFTAIAVVSLVWMLVGFSLAFGQWNGYLGDLHFAGLSNMDDVVPGLSSAVVPTAAFVAFQMMFAVITPALVTGATADRWRFSAFVVFIALWSALVYAPAAHWVFSPTGWIAKLGALDFAGGTVVHANAGAAALAMAIVLGRRRDWPERATRPHNLPMVMLGAAMLWFGWFGFNAGSAGRADGVAAIALVNTQLAACAALLAWVVVERIRVGKATSLGAASGAICGLVAVTPCAGYVQPVGAVAVGVLAGALCALLVSLKSLFNLDDSCDVVAVHLGGGVIGSLALGLFATKSVNPAGADGLLYGGGYKQLAFQAAAVVAVVIYSFVATLILGGFVGRLMRQRVRANEEIMGLDLAQHGESAYQFDGLQDETDGEAQAAPGGASRPGDGSRVPQQRQADIPLSQRSLPAEPYSEPRGGWSS
jgi:Amt family ammonium transporter